MNTASDNNLDWHAAQAALEMIKNTRAYKDKPIKASDVENLMTKTLGVLQENGVYAGLLYLYSRSEGEQPIARPSRVQLLHLTSKLHLSPPTDSKVADEVVLKDVNSNIALKFLTDNICNDLDRLLLIKQLWEQTLIYARYGAKARGVEEKAAEEAKKANEEVEKAQLQS